MSFEFRMRVTCDSCDRVLDDSPFKITNARFHKANVQKRLERAKCLTMDRYRAVPLIYCLDCADKPLPPKKKKCTETAP